VSGAPSHPIPTVQLSDYLPLGGLFLSSFLAATLLPGGSELVLIGVLKLNAALFWPAMAVATVGNTLGGLSSYALGWLLPKAPVQGRVQWVRRFGSPVLFFAWVPIVGDALCVAAGWLRLHWLGVAAFMAAGKFIRYWVIGIVSV
jgi:membrane protein YqaA with SNARE-associated domain